MHLLHLPNEILSMILDYIPQDELPVICSSCSAFMNIFISLKKVLNLEKSNPLPLSTVKRFLTNANLNLSVTELSLDGIYSHKVQTFIKKFKNIQSLKVIDLPLTTKLLQEILFTCNQLKKFHFTWPVDMKTKKPSKIPKMNCNFPGIEEMKIITMHNQIEMVFQFFTYTPKIKKITIQQSSAKRLQDYGFSNLNTNIVTNVVKNLSCLEELYLYVCSSTINLHSYMQNDKVVSFLSNGPTSLLGEVARCSNTCEVLRIGHGKQINIYQKFTNLRELVLSAIESSIDSGIILSCMWSKNAPNLRSAHFYGDMKLYIPVYPNHCKLERFSFTLVKDSVIEKKHRLNQCISEDPFYVDFLAKVANNSRLTHLCLAPFCLGEVSVDGQLYPWKTRIREHINSIQEPTKNLRQSNYLEVPYEHYLFCQIINNCQFITTLELRYFSHTYNEYFPKLSGQLFAHKGAEQLNRICHLKCLQRLTLDSIPFRYGTFFEAIAIGCPKLYFLRISALGQQGIFNYKTDLCNAFPLMKQLKFLRIHQNHLVGSSLNFIFKSLEKIPKLERLCICSYSNDNKVNTNELISFISNKSSLSFVGLILDSFTNDQVKFLTKNKQFKTKLPRYLCLKAAKYESDDFLNNIPHVFFWSMINNEPWAMHDEPLKK